MTLDELEKLEKAATPGPWSYSTGRFDRVQCQVEHDKGFVCSTNQGNDNANAALIAAARNALPELIKIARAVAEMKQYGCGGAWDAWCHFCSADGGEPHDDGCAWSAARKLKDGAQ